MDEITDFALHNNTNEYLFKLSMDMEKESEIFYRGLISKFGSNCKYFELWKKMAEEEKEHYLTLKEMYDSLSQFQLDDYSDPQAIESALTACKFNAEQSLKSIQTESEAIDISQKLERSEINSVFKFIALTFIPLEERKRLIINQLNEHQKHIETIKEQAGK